MKGSRPKKSDPTGSKSRVRHDRHDRPCPMPPRMRRDKNGVPKYDPKN